MLNISVCRENWSNENTKTRRLGDFFKPTSGTYQSHKIIVRAVFIVLEALKPHTELIITLN